MRKKGKKETTWSVLKQVRWPGLRRGLATAALSLALTALFSVCFACYGYIMTCLLL